MGCPSSRCVSLLRGVLVVAWIGWVYDSVPLLVCCAGSADRTVKFWDLETFELIGSAGPEVPDAFQYTAVESMDSLLLALTCSMVICSGLQSPELCLM